MGTLEEGYPNFEESQGLFSVSVNYNEDIGKVIGDEEYEEGERVRLAAVERKENDEHSKHEFIEWTGYIESSDPVITFDMPNEDVELTAVFADKNFIFEWSYFEEDHDEGSFLEWYIDFDYDTVNYSNKVIVGTDNNECHVIDYGNSGEISLDDNINDLYFVGQSRVRELIFDNHNGEIKGIDVEGDLVASCGDGDYSRVWNHNTGDEISAYQVGESQNEIAFNPSGDYYAVATDTSVHIVNTWDGVLVTKINEWGSAYINTVTFPQNDKVILDNSHSLYEKLYRFDIDYENGSHSQEGDFSLGDGVTINASSSSPDGTHVIFGGSDGIVRILMVDEGDFDFGFTSRFHYDNDDWGDAQIVGLSCLFHEEFTWDHAEDGSNKLEILVFSELTDSQSYYGEFKYTRSDVDHQLIATEVNKKNITDNDVQCGHASPAREAVAYVEQGDKQLILSKFEENGLIFD